MVAFLVPCLPLPKGQRPSCSVPLQQTLTLAEAFSLPLVLFGQADPVFPTASTILLTDTMGVRLMQSAGRVSCR